jgi:hypothetical protein
MNDDAFHKQPPAPWFLGCALTWALLTINAVAQQIDEVRESPPQAGAAEQSEPAEVSNQAKQSAETSTAEAWHSIAASDVGQRPGADEPLRFNFAAASWRDVLEWFAGAAGMNLNWRDLPDGDLNLITRGRYDVAGAKDVLNMHLLPRGFTLLERDGALFLMKLDESLNPTMVPRVHPDELDERGDYEFVKVSLPLDWMLAQSAATELAPILSPYGKIIPLTATNRIEAMA